MSDMKLHFLSTGVMDCDLTWLLLEGGNTIKSRSQKNDPPPWGEAPTHAVLIETDGQKILWDTGVARDWEQRWAPIGMEEFFPVQEDPAGPGYLDSALADLELTPDDIDVLVLSHLHFDHAANAQDFNNGKTRILCHADEIEGVKSIQGEGAGGHLVSDFAGLPFEAIHGDDEIAPGVSVIHTPGHTWGTMSLRVDLPNDGTHIFTSDAVYLGASWGPPAIGAAIVWDSVQWLESVDKLRRIQEQTGAKMIFGHDAEQRKTMKISPNGYYS